jgi:hypothetical protein
LVLLHLHQHYAVWSALPFQNWHQMVWMALQHLVLLVLVSLWHQMVWMALQPQSRHLVLLVLVSLWHQRAWMALQLQSW